MPKQDINNQADESAGRTESQVKFIKVLKPATPPNRASSVKKNPSQILIERRTGISCAPKE